MTNGEVDKDKKVSSMNSKLLFDVVVVDIEHEQALQRMIKLVEATILKRGEKRTQRRNKRGRCQDYGYANGIIDNHLLEWVARFWESQQIKQG